MYPHSYIAGKTCRVSKSISKGAASDRDHKLQGENRLPTLETERLSQFTMMARHSEV